MSDERPNKDAKLDFRVEESIRRRLDDLAEQRQVSRAQLLTDAVVAYLGEDQPDEHEVSASVIWAALWGRDRELAYLFARLAEAAQRSVRARQVLWKLLLATESVCHDLGVKIPEPSYDEKERR